MNWKYVFGSVAGTSHLRRGEVCQDACWGREIQACQSTFLVLACADGAGTASHSAIGSKLACQHLVRTIANSLQHGQNLAAADKNRVTNWYRAARGQISLEACCRNLSTRDFAATLLVAVVGEEHAVFAQIGDGAIVIERHSGEYETVFWPQSGEYINTTNFLNDDSFEDRLEFAVIDRRIDNLALITDGLEPLALHFKTRSVHNPFFQPMFEQLRGSIEAEELDPQLVGFLASGPVCNRTDDDKTLMLATRTSFES